VRSGRISLPDLTSRSEQAEVAELAARHFSAESDAALRDAAAELLALPVLADLARAAYDGSPRSQVALKRLTSELVGRFAAAVTATRTAHGDGPLRRYAADLVVPARVAAE